MKRCPKCRRDYHDDSLLYCLDDGAALGENDNAFASLNDAYENRDSNFPSIKVDPTFDPLRDDRRFKELQGKPGFPNKT